MDGELFLLPDYRMSLICTVALSRAQERGGHRWLHAGNHKIVIDMCEPGSLFKVCEFWLRAQGLGESIKLWLQAPRVLHSLIFACFQVCVGFCVLFTAISTCIVLAWPSCFGKNSSWLGEPTFMLRDHCSFCKQGSLV